MLLYNFRSEDEIKKDMLSNIKNTVDRSENSIVHDALGPAGIEFQHMNVELDYVAGKLDVENLEAVELDKFVRKDKDSILVFKSRSERWLEKEYLGLIDDKTSNFF